MRVPSCGCLWSVVERIAGPHTMAALWGVATLTPCQDFVELPWRVDENGRLEVQVPVDGADAATTAVPFGAWHPVFADLFTVDDRGAPGIAHRIASRPFDLVPLLVHGPGGAAAVEEAPRRLRRLGLGLTVDPWVHQGLQPDPLVDQLRVRHLASVDLPAARYALSRSYLADEHRDRLVRSAAAAALLEADPEQWSEQTARAAELCPPRDGAAALRAGLSRLPDQADLILFVNGSAMPPPTAAVRAYRVRWAEVASALCLAAGGNQSPAMRTGISVAADAPAQLPYELAGWFGNFRIDGCLFARTGGDRAGWWGYLVGVFRPDLFAAGMRAGGGAVTRQDAGSVAGRVGGYEVTVTESSLEFWPAGLDIGPRGSFGAALRDRADENASPVWMHLPKQSAVARALGVGDCVVDVRFDVAPRALSVSIRCPDDAAANRVRQAFDEWRSAHTCERDGVVPGMAPRTWGDVAEGRSKGREWQLLVLRRLTQAVEVRGDAGRLGFVLDLTPHALSDLVGCLIGSPAAMLRTF